MNKARPYVAMVNGLVTNDISISDRGLSYGDGVFETLAVRDGHIQFLDYHLQRLGTGCARLRIKAPNDVVIENECRELISGQDDCVLKIIVTRGAGGRGYRADPDLEPTRIVSMTEWPDIAVTETGFRITVCETRLARNPALAGIKHLNRLEQVLARSEWEDPEIHEGLMLDSEDKVIAGTMSNVFATRNGALRTPDVSRCGISGVMRRVVLETAEELQLESFVCEMGLDDLLTADELFITNALMGITPVTRLCDKEFPSGATTQSLMNAIANKGKS